MRGLVEAYDPETGVGILGGEDGRKYSFTRLVVQDVDVIEIGLSLRFVNEGANVSEAIPVQDWSSVRGWETPDPPPTEELEDAKDGPGPLHYWIKCLILYAYGRGRASPGEFFSFHVVNFIILILLAVTFTLLGDAVNQNLLGWIVFALFLLTLPPTLALTVRRLHDAGFSGWFALVYFVPALGWILLAFVLLLMPSQRHTNKYGRHPRARRSEPEVAPA